MSYNEILRLKEMLEKANIPFEFTDEFLGNKGISYYYPAYQIIVSKNRKRLCDAVEYFGSYGHEKDLIEIMGALTIKEQRQDSVLGWLSAEEVFKRFKYCYEHNTTTYRRRICKKQLD